MFKYMVKAVWDRVPMPLTCLAGVVLGGSLILYALEMAIGPGVLAVFGACMMGIAAVGVVFLVGRGLVELYHEAKAEVKG
jgi:hypothetical protein